jgi:hypothetical protein
MDIKQQYIKEYLTLGRGYRRLVAKKGDRNILQNLINKNQSFQVKIIKAHFYSPAQRLADRAK